MFKTAFDGAAHCCDATIASTACNRLENFEGGYSICFESHTADADLADLFRGLPDDRRRSRRAL